MGSLMLTAGIGFIVGILGTGLGGLIALGVPGKSVKKQSFLLGVSGGIMAAVVVWDLWPEARETHFYSAVAGAMIGSVFIILAEILMEARPGALNRHTRTGILMGMGIAMHNFPEGLAVGTVRTVGQWRDWAGLACLMTLHNVPEGMVVSAALRLGGAALSRVLSALILVETPMAAGAFLGGVVGGISARFVAASLGFAAGAMLLLVAKEMLPMGNELSTPRATWSGFAVGVLLGWALTRTI